MRSEAEIVKARDELLAIIDDMRNNRSIPGRSDALLSSDSITGSIAAAQLNALEFVLGNLDSVMKRSRLLNRKRR